MLANYSTDEDQTSGTSGVNFTKLPGASGWAEYLDLTGTYVSVFIYTSHQAEY